MDDLMDYITVPYGIETGRVQMPRRRIRLLLIVPYGIETLQNHLKIRLHHPFNRTLWN